jgi:Na+/proline symporter
MLCVQREGGQTAVDMANVLYFTPFALYLGAVVFVTLTTRSKSEDADYFFASKRLGTLQALLSVVSSETSVATTVVFPAAGLAGGYTLVWLLLGYIVGRSIVALYYLRALYDSSRLTIYQTMSGNHRILEGSYLLAKYISGGVRFFIGGYALHQLLGGRTEIWILVVAVCVAGYSLTGGLRAVVVMDQIQSGLLVITGVFLCIYLWRLIPAGAVQTPALFDWDSSKSTFSPVMFLGGVVLSIGSHGADQDMLLRILSTKSFNDARRSLILSGFAAAGLIGLFLTIGYLLQYTGAADLNLKSPLADYVEKSNVPLLKGVFLVLLAAAAMSSLDSTIHSTGAIWKSLMNSKLAGRYWSSLSLFIMIGFALTFTVVDAQGRHEDFLALCMGSMNYVNAGLIGIFTVFTFFPRRLALPGVLAALVVGFTVTAVCEWAFTPPLPWTRTVLLASGASFAACFGMGHVSPNRRAEPLSPA